MSSVMDTRFISESGHLFQEDDNSLDPSAPGCPYLGNESLEALMEWNAQHDDDGNFIGSHPQQVPFASQPVPGGLPDSGSMAVDSDLPATGYGQLPQSETETPVVLPYTQEGPQVNLNDAISAGLDALDALDALNALDSLDTPITPPPELAPLAPLAPLVGVAPSQPSPPPRFIPPWDCPSEPQRHSEFWPQSHFDPDPNYGLFGLPPSATANINIEDTFIPEVSEVPQANLQTPPGPGTALSSDPNVLGTTSFQSAFQLPDPFWQPHAMTAEGNSGSQSVLHSTRPVWRAGMDIPEKPQQPLPDSQPTTLHQHGDMPPSSTMSSLPTPQSSGLVTPIAENDTEEEEEEEEDGDDDDYNDYDDDDDYEEKVDDETEEEYETEETDETEEEYETEDEDEPEDENEPKTSQG
ncbi:hypothetical protein LIA77_02951 [Sarocladium implicatum]|nr:hypothetical protein LIA77_02951 [Sarocladium implicatum]